MEGPDALVAGGWVWCACLFDILEARPHQLTSKTGDQLKNEKGTNEQSMLEGGAHLVHVQQLEVGRRLEKLVDELDAVVKRVHVT